MDQNKLLVAPRHQGVPLGVSTMISKPMARLAQTVHLSCIDTNIVSKWTETRFHRTQGTEEFHRVRLKHFSSPWYFHRKPCTYVASRLALSPNGPKWDSIRPTAPRSTIVCIRNDFRAHGTFSANHAPILHQDEHYVQTDWNELPIEPCHLGVPSGVSKAISEPMVYLAQSMPLSCTDTNTISK
jgi:hypothetical protein